jgi:hypothetical protein
LAREFVHAEFGLERRNNRERRGHAHRPGAMGSAVIFNPVSGSGIPLVYGDET